MRIFIHNVDSYIGRALVKELRKADGGLNRIFGTVKSGSSAPPAVKRVVCRDDPKKAKKMAETMQSCRLVVISLNDCSLEDLHFAITALKVDPKVTPPKVLGELESEVIFLVISSVMVWADTKPEAPGQAIKASDYLRRVPQAGSKFEQWKEMEDLVFRCFNREASQVKAFVVAGGLLYGEGEEIFAPAFQDARGVSDSMVDMSPGVNKVPRVHVRDLARLVRQVSLTAEGINPLEATPYFLAVDQPPSAVLQTDLVGIVDKVGEHYEVPRVDAEAMKVEEPERELREALALDLNLDPSAVASAEDLCANSDPPGACKPPPESSDVSPNAQCTIAVGQSSSEIRTKVFRIGAPLLRSTIPVSLGARGGYGGGRVPAAPAPEVKTRREGEEEKEGSDIETILSLSDGEAEPEELLSVTLDFPC